MPVIHAQVSLQSKTGMPRDAVVNTFTFGCAADFDAATQASLTGALSHFYNLAASGTGIILSSRLSAVIDRTKNPTVKYFDITSHLDGTPAGSPVAIDSLTLMSAASTPLPMPSEVSCVLTAVADYLTDVEFGAPTGVGSGRARPRERDRGRLYIGPLNQDTLAVDGTTSRPNVHDQFRQTLVQVADHLQTELTAGPLTWTVWSRKNATVKKVVEAWCDDSFDVQRRRGEKATAREYTFFP